MPIYCELPIWGEIFEPLNTISNLAFIIAAYFVWRLVQQQTVAEAGLRRQLLILASILAAIGVGSGLWHFFREPWALALDVIPIQLFLVTFWWFLLQRLTDRSFTRTILLLAFIGTALVGPSVLQSLLPLLSAGGYSAPLLFAFVASYFVWKKQVAAGRYFFITLLVFALSLTTRQLDLAFCTLTDGHGLHIFWHILNGYVLYRFARLLVIFK